MLTADGRKAVYSLQLRYAPIRYYTDITSPVHIRVHSKGRSLQIEKI